MQSYKTYLQPEREGDHPFARAYRETFLFQLINDVVKREPDGVDNGTGPDGAEHIVQRNAMTLEQKRRLRNQIFGRARELEASGGSVYDPDTLVSAFLDTDIGQDYKDYITENWRNADSPQRQKYDAAIRKWTLNWSNTDKFSVTISPYDPLFVNSDIFDEHDQLLYWGYDSSKNQTDMIDRVFVGKGREIAVSNRDLDHRTSEKFDMENEVTASGYRILEHYIKSKRDKRDIRNKLIDQYHANNDKPISPKEAEYMEAALKYLSEQGFEFDIRPDKNGKICAVLSGSNIEVRLLDREEPEYQGRIYDNGRIIRYGMSKGSHLAVADSITTEDRKRLLTYYLGIDQPMVYADSEMAENNISRDKVPFIGQQIPFELKSGTRKERTVSASDERSSNNSVTAAVKSGVVIKSPNGWTAKDGTHFAMNEGVSKNFLKQNFADELASGRFSSMADIYSYMRRNKYGYPTDEFLNIQISASSVSSMENSPEVMFNNRLAISDAYFTNPDKMARLLDDKGVYSAAFRSLMGNGEVLSYGVFSDINGNMFDPNGSVPAKYPEYAADLTVEGEGADAHLSFKEGVSEEHKNTYRALVIRNVLADWVQSAKLNFMEQVDVDGMAEAYNQWLLSDGGYTPDFSDDDLVAEYQKKYWSVLTNDIPGGHVTYNGDSVSVSSLSFDEKLALIRSELSSEVDWNLFGDVPMIDLDAPGRSVKQIMYEPDEDGNVPSGFYPDNVIRYCQHDYSISQQKNQNFILHMLNELQNCGYSDAACGWVAGDSFTSHKMRNDLIQFDDTPGPDNYPVKLSYSSVFSYPNVIHVARGGETVKAKGKSVTLHTDLDKALFFQENGYKPDQKAINELTLLKDMNIPVRTEMMFHALEALGQSGCEPDSISVTMDRNGVMKYEGRIPTKRLTTAKQEYVAVSGSIGQVFEPDEYGAIHTQYRDNNSKVLIPGYSAFLVPNDPEHPVPARERLRLTGWTRMMKQAITQEIRSSAFTIQSEYNFTPHTSSLNSVYRHMYDMSIDEEDYKRMLSEPDPEQLETNKAVIRTLAGRCRFANEMSDGASTQTTSYLNHPHSGEAQRADFYYSDLNDNKNIRILGPEMDGIFDHDLTGTAKNAGTVRYLVDGAQVDPNTGMVVAARQLDGKGNPVKALGADGKPTGEDAVDYDAKCLLMKDSLFKHMYSDSWDRRVMAATQLMTALHTPRRVGVAMMTMDGWNFDDGFVVSRRFAEQNKIKDALAYDRYAERHNGEQPPAALADMDRVKSLFNVDLNTPEGRSRIYDEENHALRCEWINDPEDKARALRCPVTDSGDFPFEYDESIPMPFEEQAAYAVQCAFDCQDMMRPLIVQDKMSDMHGNKGVISRVVDPAFITDNMKDKGVIPEGVTTIGDAVSSGVVVSVGVADKNGNTVYDKDGQPVQETVIDFRYLRDPSDPGKALMNPYRADGNFPFTYDEGDPRTFEEQAIYAIQKAYGLQDMDDVLQVFADNEDLDVVMAPYSGMSRFNGGTVLDMMSDSTSLKLRKMQPDDTYREETVEGGMGHMDLIVVDMPADVKTHWYSVDDVSDSKGRKISGQLSWILQAKGCTAMSKLFYGNNGAAVDKIREYMIAIGMDLDGELKPKLQWSPQAGEKRRLIKLPDLDAYTPKGKATCLKTTTTRDPETKAERVSINTNKDTVSLDASVVDKHRMDWAKQLAKNGGFMELPFPLDFKTDERAGRRRKRADEDRAPYMTQPTGQGYTDGNGVRRSTWALPVLPPNLMANQELLDGSVRTHDYVDKYTAISRSALLYRACEEELIKEYNKPEKDRDLDLVGILQGKMAECISAAQGTLDEITSDIVDKRFDNKHNLIRDGLMATRINPSATAVWSADPRLDLDQVAMSTEHAKLLGLVDEAGNMVPSADDCRCLIWRDPLVQEGGVRYLKVVLDDSIRGVAINPLADKSFNGDFDGDSVAATPVLTGKKNKFNSRAVEAHTEAYKAFSLEANLLEVGTVVETADGRKIHPLYIQDGLDVKSNLDTTDPSISEQERARRQAAKDGLEELTIRINEVEAMYKADPDSVKCTNARGAEIKGEQALTRYRKEWMKELNHLAHEALGGIAREHMVVKDMESVAHSCQRMADNKSKGDSKKMRSFLNNVGIDYDVDDGGRFVPGSTRQIAGMGKDGDIITRKEMDIDAAISRYTALGVQRDTDNAIQEAVALKSDDTACGGTQAQKGVAALRNHALLEITWLTYPVTQSILQIKHNSEEGKEKDDIVRYWGIDVWNGYKMTGNFTGTADEIIASKHEVVMDYILDAAGNKIPKVDFNEETQSWEAVMAENPATGKMEPVYEMAPRKCTKEEWIQQMLGMEKALRVDINPDFIHTLADIMEYDDPFNKDGGKAPAHPVYNADGRTVKDPVTKMPVMTTAKTVAGLATYTHENGTLLDKVAYSQGKFKALYDECLKPEDERQSLIHGSVSYARKLANIMMEDYDKKDRQQAREHNDKLRAVEAERPKSCYFMADSTRNFLAGGIVKTSVDEYGRTVKERIPVACPGSRKNMVSDRDLANYTGTYMQEPEADWQNRLFAISERQKEKESVQAVPAADPVPAMEPVLVPAGPARDEVPRGVSAKKMQMEREAVEDPVQREEAQALLQM